MTKFTERISDLIGPLAEKITGIHFLMALSEAMQSLLPVTMTGSFAALFAFVDIGGYQAFLGAHPAIMIFFMKIQSLTLSLFSLYVVFFLPYYYAKRLNFKEPAMVIPIAVASFLVLTPTELYTSIPQAWLGHSGLFSAMIIGFAVPRLMKIFNDKNIYIRMPAGVPRVVENAFASMISGITIIVAFALVGVVFENTPFGNFHNMIYTLLQTPLKNVGVSFPVYLLYQIVMTLTMFCGIHGSSVGSAFSPVFAAASQENLAAFAAGEALPNIIAGAFENCILIGGIGATMAAGILLLFFARSKRYKQLSRIAIVPQIFNIGEPLLFGVPIMLNPLLLIPYLGGVIVNTVIVYFSVWSGLVGRFTGVTIPWTLQGILGGFLGNEVPWQGLLLQLAVLLIDMVIWYPFIRIIDNQALAQEQDAEAAEIQTAN